MWLEFGCLLIYCKLLSVRLCSSFYVLQFNMEFTILLFYNDFSVSWEHRSRSQSRQCYDCVIKSNSPCVHCVHLMQTFLKFTGVRSELTRTYSLTHGNYLLACVYWIPSTRICRQIRSDPGYCECKCCFACMHAVQCSIFNWRLIQSRDSLEDNYLIQNPAIK